MLTNRLARVLPILLTSLILVFATLSYTFGNTLLNVKIQKRDKTRTLVTFLSKSSPDFEIFENLSKQIFIVKFRNSSPGSTPMLKTTMGSLINGFSLHKVTDNEFWVKIRTREPGLLYKIQRFRPDDKRLKILFYQKATPLTESRGIEITDILRELNPTTEKLYIFSDKPLQHDVIKDRSKPGKRVKIRLFNANIKKGVIIPGARTDILKSIKLEKLGKYINLVLTPQKYALIVTKRIQKKPIRLTFTIRENKKELVTDPDFAAIKIDKKKEEEKAEQEKLNRFLTKRFNEAEKFFKIGRFKVSSLMFKNIFNFAPRTEIGVRANFRAADALFEHQRKTRERGGEQLVNQEYRSAINSALVADLGYEEVPRAYYNMGRDFLYLKFYEDAYNQFEILIKNYPESPYARNALFHQGIIHLNMERYGKAIESLSKYVEENPRSPWIHIAYYKIGEAQFQQKQYQGAKKNFEKAWSLNSQYMKKDAELMFHMGEAYFENQDFQTARAIYEELIDLFPKESFSNLVAIRIGDFLREESKYDDAIKAYKRAINEYPKELSLIGKLRIANILAERPGKSDYKKALDIYDFIITKHLLSDQLEEAMLRKALTLSLFHHYPEAISSLEAFCQRFPKNIYVKNNIIHDRVLKTINDYISDYYFQRKYLDALGVFEQYQKKYFTRPETSACFFLKEGADRTAAIDRLARKAPLFLIADAYYRLRLHDKTIAISELILKDLKGSMAPLVLFMMGKVHDSKGEPEKAQKIFSRFIRLYPDYTYTPQVKKALGDSYFKVHKPDRISRAIRIYLQTIRDYQDSEDVLEREIVHSCWFALGNLYQGIGQYNDSINAYKNVLNSYEHPLQSQDVDETIVETHFILGNLYLELNQLPEALEAYEKAIRLFPDSDKTPWAKYYKGEIFIKNNQKDKALKIFEELIKAAQKKPDALWGPLAKESHKAMLNDLKYDKYLKRTPDAATREK